MYDYCFSEFLSQSNKVRMQQDMVKLEEEEQRQKEALANPNIPHFNR